MTYAKNFLSNVVLRLDFAAMPALMTDKKTPFSQAIETRYPNVTANPAQQLQFTWGAGGTAFEQQPRGWVWTHASPSNNRSVILAADSLAIEYKTGEYKNFAEFRGNIEFVFDAFRQVVHVDQLTRVGLRYIDEIDPGPGDPLDWAGLISSPLVTSVKAGLMRDMALTRSMHQLTGQLGDMSVLFNYGIHNPDFPSPVARRLFVLDFDIFVSGGVAAADLVGRVTEMNRCCEQMFEASIEDGLRAIMGKAA